jgi:hypothetical protein
MTVRSGPAELTSTSMVRPPPVNETSRRSGAPREHQLGELRVDVTPCEGPGRGVQQLGWYWIQSGRQPPQLAGELVVRLVGHFRFSCRSVHAATWL